MNYCFLNDNLFLTKKIITKKTKKKQKKKKKKKTSILPNDYKLVSDKDFLVN